MRRVVGLSVALGFAWGAAAAPAPEDPPKGLEHVRSVGGIDEYRLESNGLRVLSRPNEGLPVATVMVTYDVGSRNETRGVTGATHILEHMMFRGTERYNAQRGNSYSRQMERVGARTNASTFYDRTNYFANVPAEHVDLALDLEADRMRNLRLREKDLANEMTVVLNEYQRRENNPVQTLFKEVFGAAFLAHPYNHPVIGWRSDIEAITAERLETFYDRFYRPDNAVVTLIGGFEPGRALRSVREHFGPIEAPPAPIPEVTTEEPEQRGERRTVVRRAGQRGAVVVAHKTPAGVHEDWAALRVLAQILGADQSGRLYRALEDTGKAAATFTFAPRLQDPALFFVGAYLTSKANHEEVESILLEELRKIAETGVGADELKRAKSVMAAETVYGRDGPYAIASEINEAIAAGDWTHYVTLPEAAQDVAAKDVQQAARRYFTSKRRTTGWFVPVQRSEAAGAAGGLGGPLFFREPSAGVRIGAHTGPDGAVGRVASRTAEATGAPVGPPGGGPAEAAPASGGSSGPEDTASERGAESAAGNAGEAADDASASRVDFSSAMQTADVAGVRVIAIDMPVKRMVSFVGSFAAGSAFNPEGRRHTASLTAAMLDQGTEERGRFEIGERLDAMGAKIGFSAGAHSLSFSGRFLKRDAAPVMGLLAEQLRVPAFDPKVFQTVKTRFEAGLMRKKDDPDYRSSATLSRMLYPEGHPNRTAPFEKLVASLKEAEVASLKQFHEAHYGPRSMVLVFAGDIDFAQLKAAVAEGFEGWDGGVDHRTSFPHPKPAQSAARAVRIPDKTSVSVRFGQTTGLRRADPAYIPFSVGNFVLGGSSNARLMTEVREERGLTYDARSAHGGDIFSDGNWSVSASFSPDLLERGVGETREVLRSWAKDGVTEDEVSQAKETMTGSYLVGLSTTSAVARQVHRFVQRGFEPGFVDAYPRELDKATAQAVNEAIDEAIEPEKIARVAAGSVGSGQKASPPKKEAAAKGGRTVDVRLDTPDPSWRIAIERVYRADDALVAISRLTSEGEAAAVVSTVSDQVSVAAPKELPVRHRVVGKTWDWGDVQGYAFVESMDQAKDGLDSAKLLYPKD